MAWPIIINGHTYPETDFSDYGYRTAMPAVLNDVEARANDAETAATSATSSASSASSAAGAASSSASSASTSATAAASSETAAAGSASAAAASVASIAKDQSGGVPGLTLFKLNMRNVADTITSWFANANTAARTYTLPDKSGTVAMTSDITGTNSNTNTGDETAATIAVIAHAATGKTTPVDADELSLLDSAASYALKVLTWANLKATLKTYFDTLYQASTTGTFTITLNGCTTSPTATVKYANVGGIVTLLMTTAGLTGTSNTTASSVSGVPVGLRPAAASDRSFARVYNASTVYYGSSVVQTNGDITFYFDPSESAFTASGVKGIPNGFMITYPL